MDASSLLYQSFPCWRNICPLQHTAVILKGNNSLFLTPPKQQGVLRFLENQWWEVLWKCPPCFPPLHFLFLNLGREGGACGRQAARSVGAACGILSQAPGRLGPASQPWVRETLATAAGGKIRCYAGVNLASCSVPAKYK